MTPTPPDRQSSEERLREKIVQARYDKYETYDKLDPTEQETIDAIMQAVKAEMRAALEDETKILKKPLQSRKEVRNELKSELRNHFGIGKEN